jgi:hypothetical protein
VQPFWSIIPEISLIPLGFSISFMEEKPENSDILLPPGFRFHPSDEEKIDLYKFNPWELPSN